MEDLRKYKQKIEDNQIQMSTPSQIKNFLDQYVIGQDEAKITLSVAVYNHYKRINQRINDVDIQKSNILMIGSSGVGKTEIARTIAKYVGVPFVIADATTVTQAGYVGDDVENILLRLIEVADGDIELAEKGIIYIDEIDKITRKSENTSITRDVAGEGVQHSLLKIIEGTKSRVPVTGGRKHPRGECVEIDTSNILFICGGAFDGLLPIIEKRFVNKNSIGFKSEIKSKNDNQKINLLDEVQTQDIIKFGLVPELVGRLPIITTLQSLDKNALLKILTEPKNSIIKQYQKLFEMEDIKLEFRKDALETIVDKAIEKDIGARGLRSIIEKSMNKVMFEVPDIKDANRVVVTKNVIEGNGKSLIYNKNNKKIA